jgi:asparagine synthetase B (glutamine-hydrolysing)
VAEFLIFGFTLDGKTMTKDVSIPPIPMSVPEYRKSVSVDDVYVALKEATEKLIAPDTIIGLSGGVDSRIVAGITAEIEKIPAFTSGTSNLEKRIAHKIASTLKLPHHLINIDMHLDEEAIEKLKTHVKSSGGTLDVFNLYLHTSTMRHLKKHGIKKILTAYGFDEINCGSFSFKINSTRKFCRAFTEAFAHPLLPKQYRETAERNLIKSCQNIPFRAIYPLMWIRNVLKDYDIEDFARQKTPLIDSNVLSTITSLPHEQRICKRIQKAILRKHFPKLYPIPYAMSGLPPFFHDRIHAYMQRAIQTIFAFHNPKPLITWDRHWFMRTNLPLFHKILLADVPPFMSKVTVQKLIYLVQTRRNDLDASLLNKLTTYALLSSQINS